MDIVTPYKQMTELEKEIVQSVNEKEKKNLNDYFILYNTFGFDRELRIKTGKGRSRIVKEQILRGES